MDTITIKDLAVLCRIGVPEEERAQPQRLLLTVQLTGDFSRACASDDLRDTVNYFEVSRRVTEFCRAESFHLIEKLAGEIAWFIFRDFPAEIVSVQVKKFVLPDARYVSFELRRSRRDYA